MIPATGGVHFRSSSKLAPREHHGCFQQTSLVQVFDQSRIRLIPARQKTVAHGFVPLDMRIPPAAVHSDQWNSGFNQTTGQEKPLTPCRHTAAVGRRSLICGHEAITVANALWLSVQIEGMTRCIAEDKAYTSANLKAPTHALWDLIKSDPPLLHGLPGTRRAIVFGGGYPIIENGKVIGAIGVSGGHYSDDMEVARAGLAAIGAPVG